MPDAPDPRVPHEYDPALLERMAASFGLSLPDFLALRKDEFATHLAAVTARRALIEWAPPLPDPDEASTYALHVQPAMASKPQTCPLCGLEIPLFAPALMLKVEDEADGDALITGFASHPACAGILARTILKVLSDLTRERPMEDSA